MSTQTREPGKLHELLAAEKTVTAARDKLMKETAEKFGKPESFFSGHTTSLKTIEDATANPMMAAMQREGSSQKAVPTNVKATLEYLLGFWGKAEDLLYQKNKSNQNAVADLEFRGQTLLTALPVDELMGLEARFGLLRTLFAQIPTRDASKVWVNDTDKGAGFYKTSSPDITSKMAKKIDFVTIAPATDKFAAQIKEVSRDEIVATIEKFHFSGAATAAQKASLMETVDELIVEVKKARQRANSIPAVTDRISDRLTEVFLGALQVAE